MLDLTPPLPPVLIGHGTGDDAVPVAHARRGTRPAGGRPARRSGYRETAAGHEIGAEIVPSLGEFVAEAATRIGT